MRRFLIALPVLAQASPAAVTVPAPETVSESRSFVADALTKVAVTLFVVVIEIVHVTSVPEHAPLQPENVAPKDGFAVIVTLALAGCGPVQVDPQLRPAPEIDPLPTTCALS